jgi:hypothetical protein
VCNLRFSRPEVAVAWNITPCSLVDADRRFRGDYCLHHQSHFLFWNVGQHLPDKKKTAIFLFSLLITLFHRIRLYMKGWKRMMNWKGCIGKRSWTNYGIIPAFAWMNWGKSRTYSDRIAGLRLRFEPGTSWIRSSSFNHSTTTFGAIFSPSVLRLTAFGNKVLMMSKEGMGWWRQL